MSGLSSQWAAFFHGDVDSSPLVLFRVAFGAVVAVWMFARLRYAELLYGTEGYGAPERISGGLLLLSYTSRLRHASSAVLILGGVAGIALSLGLFTPWSAVVVFLCTVTLTAQMTFVHTSWEFVIALLSLLLAVSPAGGRASLDAALWPHDAVVTSNGWAMRLMQLQLCLVYLITVSRKLTRGLRVWLAGEPVYNLHHGPQGRFFVGKIPHPAVYRVLCWYALAIELAFPFLVWWEPTRYPALAALVVLHLGMELFLRIFPFQWVMVASLVLFVAPRHADQVLALAGLR